MSTAFDGVDPVLNLALVRQALGEYAEVSGELSIVSDVSWSGQRFPTTVDGLAAAVEYVRDLDVQGAAGIYHRGTTIKPGTPTKVNGKRVRGKLDACDRWVAVRLDIDYGKPGYAPDADTVVELIGQAETIPQPTSWTHSGHGLYPCWTLDDQPVDGPFMHALVRDLHIAVTELFRSAGYTIDPGLVSADRVWRIPGTVNRKDADAPVLARSLPGTGNRWRTSALRKSVPVGQVTEQAEALSRTAEQRAEDEALGIEAAIVGTFTRDQANAYVEEQIRERLARAQFGRNVNLELNKAAVVAGRFVPEFWTMREAGVYVGKALLSGVGQREGWKRLSKADKDTIASGLAYGMTMPYGWREGEDDGPDAGAEDAPGGAQGTSWRPVDLTALWDGSAAPEPPTILRRTDGVCLFYAGETHSVHGESESGKSWVVQAATVEVLAAGGRVLYLDFESSGRKVLPRLRDLGMAREHLAALDYVQPREPGRSMNEDFSALLANRYDLCVIDGVNVSASLYGKKINDTNEMNEWDQALPKRIAAETGAAVAMVDHVSKNAEGRGRFAGGAQAKMSNVTGSAFYVEPDWKQPLGRGKVGHLLMWVGKDRDDYIREHSGPMNNLRLQPCARFRLDATDPRGVLDFALEPWMGNDAEERSFEPLANTSDWRDPSQPALPGDIMDYKGRGQNSLYAVVRYMRMHGGMDGIGAPLAVVHDALKGEKVGVGKAAKPRYSRTNVRDAWSVLINLGRLVPTPDNRAGAPTGGHWWVARDGDPE